LSTNSINCARKTSGAFPPDCAYAENEAVSGFSQLANSNQAITANKICVILSFMVFLSRNKVDLSLGDHHKTESGQFESCPLDVVGRGVLPDRENFQRAAT
jgi:hypothetical protein